MFNLGINSWLNMIAYDCYLTLKRAVLTDRKDEPTCLCMGASSYCTKIDTERATLIDSGPSFSFGEEQKTISRLNSSSEDHEHRERRCSHQLSSQGSNHFQQKCLCGRSSPVQKEWLLYWFCIVSIACLQFCWRSFFWQRSWTVQQKVGIRWE